MFVKGLILPPVVVFNASASWGNVIASSNQVESVNRVQNLSKKKKYSANKRTISSQSGNTFNSKKSCYRCGGYHQEHNCKCINEWCHWYNKTGHIARMFRAKQKSMQNSVAHASDGDDTVVLLGVYSVDADINGVSECNGINVKVSMGSEIVPMKLDTETAVSIIPESTYRGVLSKYPLQTSNITLKSYTGGATPISGKA